jgi:hypothetical protein
LEDEMSRLLDLARAALSATPTPRTATPSEAAELRRLIAIVLASTPDEQQETFIVACADPDAALMCFRALVDAMRYDKNDINDITRSNERKTP